MIWNCAKNMLRLLGQERKNLCNSEMCVWKYICQKGCAGESIDYYGSVSQKVDVCWYYKSMFKNKLVYRRRTANVDATYE